MGFGVLLFVVNRKDANFDEKERLWIHLDQLLKPESSRLELAKQLS